MNLRFLNPPLNTPVEEAKKRALEAIDIFARLSAVEKNKGESRWQVWVDMHRQMADALAVENLLKFQSDREIGPQITGGSGRVFLQHLSARYGQAELDFLLRNHTETLCGAPKDLVCEGGTYMTVTSMRHLYHLAHLKKYLGEIYRRPLPVIEIGGGFGNLARMVCQYNLASSYTIIDHPVLHAIQYFFLTEFFPPEEVAVLGSEGQYFSGSEHSKIKLCSMFDYLWGVDIITEPYALASTMALTEIPGPGQDQYLRDLHPEFIYVFGQLKNKCIGGGRSSGEGGFSNEGLVYRLGQSFHTLEYQYFGYHFEYIGRRATFRKGR